MVFHHAIERAEPSEDVKERVGNLIDSMTYSVFMYTSRGLFERDKLTFISQVAFQVRKKVSMREVLCCHYVHIQICMYHHTYIFYCLYRYF